MSLSTQEFIQSAGLPSTWKEQDIQEYIAQRLNQTGYTTRLEVKAHGGRMDIFCPNWGKDGTVVEVKKYLSRENIYQALGQLNTYAWDKKHDLVIMGFLPPTDQEASLATASMVQNNPRVTVIFLNLVPEWYPNTQIKRNWHPIKYYPIALLIVTAILLSIFQHFYHPAPVHHHKPAGVKTWRF